MRKLIPLAVVAALTAPAAAQHAGHGGGGAPAAPAEAALWTGHPTVWTVRAGRDGAKVLVSGLEASSVTVHPPEGEPWREPLAEGMATMRTRGVGNYHWLVVRQEAAGQVRVATAARYFSNPGPAPTGLLARPMSELEIVPDPIPREHAHYRAGEAWPFVVRFRGKPLAGASLTIETAYGSRRTFDTNADGRARVVIPDDYPADLAASGGHHGRPPLAPFVVAAAHEVDGMRYLTTFSDTYRPGAFATKTVWPGLAFMGAGMLAALPLLRRKKETKA